MTADAAALDRRSLTLPDWRRALKKRVRGPHRPSWWALMWWAGAIASALAAAAELAIGHYASGVVALATAATAAQLARDHHHRGDAAFTPRRARLLALIVALDVAWWLVPS